MDWNRSFYPASWRPWLGRIGNFVLGYRPAVVPPRVAEQFRIQQYQSEILIGWTQATGILVFAFFYVISPEEITVEDPQQAVPIALAAYGLFVAIRLFLGYRNRLTRPIIALSIILDVALVLGIMSTTPVAFDGPPALSLKDTTQVFLYAIVALRALRFEPGWVIFATLTAAGGFLGLVLYAAISGGPDAITFDPKQYFTEPVILPAAEFDHITGLLAFGAVLALTVARGRNFAMSSVSSGLAARELSQFFAPKVAERITSAQIEIHPGTAESRDAAIVFFDIRGFSVLAQRLQPTEVIDLLGEYHGLVVPIVNDHGGSVDKFLGDGILVSFGAVEPSETYAADALRTAQAVIGAVPGWNRAQARAENEKLQIGAAVTSGTILFGAIGHGDRLEYTILGDAVNLAAKLEDHNKAEGVAALTTAHTLELARKQGFLDELELRPGRRVAGVDGQVDLAVVAT